MKQMIWRRLLPLGLLLGLLCGGMLGCKSGKDTEVVGDCGGDPILYEEYRYLKARLGDGLSDEERNAQLDALLIEDRAVLAAAKALVGVGVDDESVQDAVDAGVESAIESYGGKSAYKDALKEQNLTEHHFRRMLAVAELQRLAQEKLFAGTELESDTSFAEWLKNANTYARAEQFVFANRADAEAFLAAVGAGESVDSACADRNGTRKKASYFYRGLGGEATDGAIFSLPDDGKTLSGTVEQKDGTAVVYCRVAVSETEREDMAAMQGLAVRNKLRDLAWEQLLETYRTGLQVRIELTEG